MEVRSTAILYCHLLEILSIVGLVQFIAAALREQCANSNFAAYVVNSCWLAASSSV